MIETQHVTVKLQAFTEVHQVSHSGAYVTRKARKTEYKLQKFGLVLTYIDEAKGEWKILMPDSVRNSLSEYYKFYLQLAEAGKKGPSPKEIRMMSFMQQLMGEKE